MLNKQGAYCVIDNVLSKTGGYQALVIINAQENGLTRFANSEIHQNVFKDDLELEIRIKDGKKTARITINQTDDQTIEKAVQEAVNNLSLIPEGELKVPLVEQPEEIVSENDDQEVVQQFSIEKRAQLVQQGINMLDEGYTAAGSLALNKTAVAVGNSCGIRRYARLDNVSFNTVVMHQSGVSGYAECCSDKASDIDILAEFKQAYQKVKVSLNPVSIEPGSYTVILEPLAVGDLLSYLAYIGFSGRSVQKGMSFLKDKQGEQVFGKNITIVDDNRNENTMNLPFDLEGSVRKTVKIIEEGVAKELTYDLKSAVIDQVETTGHSLGEDDFGGFPVNLLITGGEKTLEELIEETKQGILVTRFHYMNVVDPRQAVLTALTRDGTFLIKDGKITEGIKNLRFTESMLEAFNKVVGITKERKKVPHFMGYSYVPAFKIEDFHFTGRTEVNEEGF